MAAPVEIVMPAYNAAAYIAAALESVLAQDVSLRVHVVDDGSTDATAEVVRPFLRSGRVDYVHQRHSGRPGLPRNRGLRAVEAPFVAFFDADDLMRPGHLRRALDLLESQPAWIAVTADYQNFRAGSPAPATHFATCPRLSALLGSLRAQGPAAAWSCSGVHARRLLAEENFSISGAVVYRTGLVRRLGGSDEALGASVDFDLLWRAARYGALGVSTHVALDRRLHAGNLTNDHGRALEWKVVSRRQLLAQESDPAARQALRHAIAGFQDALAADQIRCGRGGAGRSAYRAVGYGLVYGRVPWNTARQGLARLVGRWRYAGA